MDPKVIAVLVLLMCCCSSSVGAFFLIPGETATGPTGPTGPTGSTTPTDPRTSKSTPSDDFAQGSLIHLDRHDVNCDAGQGISGFTLTKDGADKMKYDYKCLDVPGGALGPRKDTGPQEWGGNKVIYLDRQSLDCGNKAITEFGLYRPATDKLSYEYKCSTVAATGACREVNAVSPTKTDKAKIDTILDLDVECEKDEVMTKFRYYRNAANTSNESGAYRYTCCKQ
jgi:hypothetical protein